jgi:hypothetical protein
VTAPEADRAAVPIVCARCARTPRDTDDRLTWITIDDEDVCPGCLSLNDTERLRADGR